jgi:hypothetical protein
MVSASPGQVAGSRRGRQRKANYSHRARSHLVAGTLSERAPKERGRSPRPGGPAPLPLQASANPAPTEPAVCAALRCQVERMFHNWPGVVERYLQFVLETEPSNINEWLDLAFAESGWETVPEDVDHLRVDLERVGAEIHWTSETRTGVFATGKNIGGIKRVVPLPVDDPAALMLALVRLRDELVEYEKQAEA